MIIILKNVSLKKALNFKYIYKKMIFLLTLNSIRIIILYKKLQKKVLQIIFVTLYKLH